MYLPCTPGQKFMPGDTNQTGTGLFMLTICKLNLEEGQPS